MYALMIARAYTGRKVVVKVGGGWHGANPLALKGVAHSDTGYDSVDSAGVSSATDDEIIVTRFNDVEALERVFAAHGDRIAAFIFEPCPSVAGFIPASLDFMQAARRLTAQYGAVLILDEVITGFRYCASGAQRLYGVQADLSTYRQGDRRRHADRGGGGPRRPHGADQRARQRRASGSTAAPTLRTLCLSRPGLAMLRYLIAHEDTLYAELNRKGADVAPQDRRGVRVPWRAGPLHRSRGMMSSAGSSLGTVYLSSPADLVPQGPDDLNDPQPVRHRAARDRAQAGVCS